MSPSPTLPGVALVTGAADRVGAVIARRLAEAGWAVLVHCHTSRDKAEIVVDGIRARGGRADIVAADLTDRPARAGLIAEAAKPFGPLTLLVNNASAFEADSVRDIDETLWDLHFALHAEAPAFLSRDFAAQLPDGTQGNIVNIVDQRVLDLSPAYFSYTLSKATLWTATQTMAQSLAPAIRVNAIGPGPTIAPPGQPPGALEAAWARLPLGYSADADGIADGVLAILNLPAMTGQMLALDGGQHLQWPDRRGPTPRK